LPSFDGIYLSNSLPSQKLGAEEEEEAEVEEEEEDEEKEKEEE
jgi:hypothetical protein